MDSEGSSSGMPGSDNQDSNEPAPPGTAIMGSKTPATPLSSGHRLLPSSKGVENAKKRLRAFSIQKKTPITPSQLVKQTASGSMAQTVLIGRLSSVKVIPKGEDDQKKPPKPPKPGSSKRNFQDSHTDLQKRTLAEIEDMKRKMELVDLGIPLGLICPSSNNDKAMPTKAMPPIKSFLGPRSLRRAPLGPRKPPKKPKGPKRAHPRVPRNASKVDEIIRDAKAAKAEGREFKFDYQKLLPDYDNPFQRKKDDPAAQEKEKEEIYEKEEKYERHYTPKSDRDRDRSRDSSKRKSDRYSDFRRHSDYRREDKDRYKEKRSGKIRDRDKETKESRESSETRADKAVEQEVKETDVNLNDYLVCDSWSLDNDEKTSSPQVEDKSAKTATPVRKETKTIETEFPKEPLRNKDDKDAILKAIDSPKTTKKIEKLQPVIDSFKFEIDPNDDEILDNCDEETKLDNFAKPKTRKSFNYNQDTNTSYSLADDNFLESVINEIKQENLSEDESQDKGLVEYDSPMTDYSKGQGTPELDDSMRANTSQSDYSDGIRSTESKYSVSSYKSTESGYKSTSSIKSADSRKEVSVDKAPDKPMEREISKATAESLEMWNFVLKICQPLLFRHDKKSCYKRTLTAPTLWWAGRAASCACVRGRGLVLAELRAQRMPLVDRVYGCDQIFDSPFPKKRSWYPPAAECLAESVTVPGRPGGAGGAGGMREDDLLLDREYQRFMEAVWPEGTDAVQSQSNTPVRPAGEDEDKEDDRRKKKAKLSSEGWSQESDLEEELENRSKKQKTVEKGKERKRKRKRSSSTLSSATDDDGVQRKKKKDNKKSKSKLAKRARTEKKYLKKLKEKQKKKKKQAKVEKMTEVEDIEEPKKKQKDKKTKKKQAKLKKHQKKKKAKANASISSSSSSSSSSESEDRPKKKKAKRKTEDAFDVNILNNIKTEKLTDDEKCHNMQDDEFSPRRQQSKRQEIIDVKELQSDLGVQIKKEVEDVEEEEAKMEDFDLSNNEEFIEERAENGGESHAEKIEFKEPQDLNRLTPQPRPPADETNLSQCSSQESLCSETDRTHQPTYEKDDSHLRPSSQNSNYSFNDVIASQSGYNKIEASAECEKFEYEQENYEMYEQLAMAYQSDVASNQVPLPAAAGAQRIETVALRRRGEIKCDWRAGDAPAHPASTQPRSSRWGLKPSEVNIVLTGGSSEHFAPPEEPVYQIESIANRNDNSTGYDEAYMDTYGAMDRLQYGDCFAAREPRARRATLDDRIDQALRHTALGDMATEPEHQEADADKESTDKGILITRPGARAAKRVSFADGYKPGQDSDTEEPPIKKKKKSVRVGCAWPCPATHPDHVPLWDALPPPPPPPSPPPPPRAAPPLHLLRRAPPPPALAAPAHAHAHAHKFDPSMPLTGFMPPEPPPGLITFPPVSGFP